MKLKLLEVKLKLPKEIPIEGLRPWIVKELIKLGDPLRWSISSIKSLESNETSNQLVVEAVVIIP